MALTSNIRWLLTSDAGVTALVGTRIYPLILPQNPTLPAISYGLISAIRDTNLSSMVGLVEVRYQFDCWALTLLEAEAMADALRAALHGFQGPVGGSPATGNVSGSFAENERHIYEPDTEIYRISTDYFLFVQEEV